MLTYIYIFPSLLPGPELSTSHPQSPEELKAAYPLLQPTIRALGGACFSVSGFEADDVMASIGMWAKQRYWHALLLKV